MSTVAVHLPVLVDRVVELLASAPEGVIVDCTVGAGGHARAVLDARQQLGLETIIVGIDRDPEALDEASRSLAGAPVELVQARFDEIGEVLDDLGVARPAGVLYDLGISSMHVDRAERGFSYRQEGPLDMRMDPGASRTAAEIVNRAEPRELTRIISRYGEERFARRIADAIVRARPLTTTTELAEVVRDAIPAAARRGGPHPATRTFQALRIAVNDELDALTASLPEAIERLVVDGICVAISYHSLEDRIVKRAFVEAARSCICPPDFPVCACDTSPTVEILTRRPEQPDDDEIAANPRARSARLRAARRIERTNS
jgi:16S rRNA (cytosine1402-N4)-methyltransferase